MNVYFFETVLSNTKKSLYCIVLLILFHDKIKNWTNITVINLVFFILLSAENCLYYDLINSIPLPGLFFPQVLFSWTSQPPGVHGQAPGF